MDHNLPTPTLIIKRDRPVSLHILDFRKRDEFLVRRFDVPRTHVALVVPAVGSAADVPRRPNIVIILGDDLGFADMGAFGSEIKTPNLDSLAKEGVRFTNFYTHASCSPTRSMLLSGVDTHLNGLGNMDEWTAPNQWGVDGYEGYLNKRVVTLPQLLKDGAEEFGWYETLPRTEGRYRRGRGMARGFHTSSAGAPQPGDAGRAKAVRTGRGFRPRTRFVPGA